MFDPTTKPKVGLFTTTAEHEPVALAGVSIDAEIRHFYAKVVVAHRYLNREETPIEAVYVFPLDEGAAVCGFEAIVDGTLVVGEALEREKAFERYDDAIEQGHGAYLLDEERPDVFQASIGNLPPGKEALVKLTCVTELNIDEGRLRFAIPTTVSPRYAPAEDRRGTGRPDSEALNPPLAWDVPHGLQLSVTLVMPGRIARVESPSHPISVTMNDREAAISLAQQDVALDRDFVLSVEAAGLDAPHALVERDDDGTEAVAVSFAPKFDAASAPAEVIFVVDRSGSMGGDSIEEVRNALQLCLRSMTPGCRFNIVGFGTQHQALFPESRAYDQASLQAASEHVATLQADLGGTEILPALRFALEQRRSPELPRQVVVLTDGEVTNTDAVLALAASHANHARIFTFGIGAGASSHLVRGLARAGGGTAEFIYPGERIEPKVLRQFARLLSPALTDVRVEWVGGAVTQSPLSLPPVFAGGRLLVYGFVKDRRPAAARLSATSPSGRLAFEVALDDDVGVSRRTVTTLAARARIRELEEGDEWLSGRGSRQRERKATSAKNEIVALGTKYGLASRETSLVAVERRDTPVVGEMKLRKVPIALTTGWGGRHDEMLAGGWRSQLMSAHPDAMLQAPFAADYMCLEGDSDVDEGTPLMRAPAFHFERPSVAPQPASYSSRKAPAAPSGLQALIVLQAADGSWELTPQLAAILGRDLRELMAAVVGAIGAGDIVMRAWATALAVAWLERHAMDVEDEWRMLARKARRWIEERTVIPPVGRTWLEVAREYLS